jgi:RNA polymerase sigma-70 factor (ECF subfamily)
MMFHHARRATRLSSDGVLLTLEEQDRSLWDQAGIAHARATLDAALALGAPGPYQVQAAIASLHCHAARADQTDWPQIAALYGRLLTMVPSPVVELNAAVALAMAKDVASGLAWVNEIERRNVIDDYYLLASTKAEMLRRLGHHKQAERLYRRARRLCRNEAERRLLSRRILECAQQGQIA